MYREIWLDGRTGKDPMATCFLITRKTTIRLTGFEPYN